MVKIYIIDDDPDIIDFLTLVLEKEGYKVGFQRIEEKAVENAAAFKADLIILDIIFPENDNAGFEIARELKHDELTRNIPVLILSAVNEMGNYSGTFSNKDKNDIYLPIEEFVEKPVEPAKLITMVNKLLSKTEE